jgi:hypothetical protein
VDEGHVAHDNVRIVELEAKHAPTRKCSRT